MPKKIVFVKGIHGGLTFVQGKGPAERVDIGGGVLWLANSPNFWYCEGNRSVSAQYINDNKDLWTSHP